MKNSRAMRSLRGRMVHLSVGLLTAMLTALSTGCGTSPPPAASQSQFLAGQNASADGELDVAVQQFTLAIDTALDGKGPRPPPESLHPFQQETVVGQYLDVLLSSQSSLKSVAKGAE